MVHSDKVLILFANCKLTKGSQRTLLFDMQCKKYYFIPNSLYDILTNYKNRVLQDIYKEFDITEHQILNQYFNFLLENNLAFLCDKKNAVYFKDLNNEWDFPFDIQNIVIDFNQFDNSYLNKLSDWMADVLYIPHIQVRIFDCLFNNILLKDIIDFLNKTSTKTYQLIVPHNEELTVSYIHELCDKKPKIELIIIYNSPIEYNKEANATIVHFTKQNPISSKSCGCVNPSLFNLTIEHFTESQSYNTCLNRKISIDVNGEIKNCPSMQKSFGNIKDTTVKEVMGNPEFKELWQIHKEQIKICQDCEFRHICTDCRAYIENPDDIYSKPLKCGYNPYKCEWEEWSTHPAKQKAIQYYELV